MDPVYISIVTDCCLGFDKEYSEPGKLTCGVQLGSVLGPVIFLLYVNDMSQYIDCDLLLYEDDPCLIFTGKHIRCVKENPSVIGLSTINYLFILEKPKLNQ